MPVALLNPAAKTVILIARVAVLVTCLGAPAGTAVADPLPRLDAAVRVSAGWGTFEESTWAYPGVDLVGTLRFGAARHGFVDVQAGYTPLDMAGGSGTCVGMFTLLMVTCPAVATAERTGPYGVTRQWPAILVSTEAMPLQGHDVRDRKGAKSWAVKKAVQLMAKGIRAGNFIVHKIISYLDKKAAEVFRARSYEIAEGLDDIAKIPDLTVRIVKEKITYFMVETLKMNDGTATVIAGAIEAALWVFL